MTDWRGEFLTPKFLIALLAVCVFVWAYAENVDDETMKGAIIGGFNLALGFYLGSNNSASRAAENTGKAFDAINALAPSSTPTEVVVTNTGENAIPVEEAK